MSLFICGTDTGAGKTLTAAALLWRYRTMEKLRYYKPVQTGAPEDDDRATVQRLTGLPDERFVPTGNTFAAPLSPHRAAELEERELQLDELLQQLEERRKEGPLLVEGAGGLFVPLNRRCTWLDYLQRSRLPVVIAARSGLGTINHSLLTVRALRAGDVTIAGLVFIGPDNPDNARTVSELSGVPILGAFEFREQNDIRAAIDPTGALATYF